MTIHTVNFTISAADYKKCPKTTLPEYAFVGRSNVGKSSLINMLMQREKLARTSSTPGKTLLINHFLVNEKWYLVDLPGFGFAKISKDQKEKINQMTLDYLKNRENLRCVMMLIDIRLVPQDTDMELMAWMGENQVPFVMVFTKADKIPKSKVLSSVEKYQNFMRQSWVELPEVFITSSSSVMGREELLKFIDKINKM